MKLCLALSAIAILASGAAFGRLGTADRTATPQSILKTSAEIPTELQPQTNPTDSTIVTIESTGPVKKADGKRPSGTWASFDQMHEHYTHAFVNSEGNGMLRIRTFDEPYQRQLFVNGEPFKVIGLNLLGLMNEPVVYESPWVGAFGFGLKRDQLDLYAKRNLTEFEVNAVEMLKNDQRHVWQPPTSDSTPEQLISGTLADDQSGTLVASLRATETCIACHEAEPNQVLGAFVYQLAPAMDPLQRKMAILKRLNNINPVAEK